ncbi:MAG: hypothetical protein II101_06100, partial [Ruminococcus sp.]|nr:hypothetical protein [Ruminococcus sp.]
GVHRRALLLFQTRHSGANFTQSRRNALSAADASLFQGKILCYSLRRCVIAIYHSTSFRILQEKFFKF